MRFSIEMVGTRPMLQHNCRLGNPLDEHAMRMKQLTGKRNKTDEDLAILAYTEARGAAYETPEGLLGLPTQNVWRCVYEAAKAFKKGEDVKRALSFEDTVEPLLVAGEKVSVEDFLDRPGAVNYRSVRVPPGPRGKMVSRARPIVHDWSTTVTFDLLDDVMDVRDLVPVVERAGRLVGVGDWRPTYGTFEARIVQW